MIKRAIDKFTAEQVEKGHYELIELSVNIPQAKWDIKALIHLAEVRNNPGFPHPRFRERAIKTYEDARKQIRDRNYDYYDDPEFCKINFEALRHGKKDDIIPQALIQIKELSYPSTLYCLRFVWNQKSFSKEEKLNFSYEALLNETNPFAIHYACMKVETEGGANLKKDYLLETEEYINWLMVNKDKKQ